MANSLGLRAIRRAKTILHEDGLLALAFRILGETVYRRVLLAARNAADAGYPPDSRCRWLALAEAAGYAEFHPEVPEAEVRRRFARGHRCWVLVSDSQLAHGLWVAPRAWIDYLDLELPLARNEIYLYQTFTPSGLRGRGFGSAAMRAVLPELHREGWRRVVLCIQPDRSVAYPPVYRAGFVPFAYLGWYRFGSRRWTFRRAASRFPFYAPPQSVSSRGER